MSDSRSRAGSGSGLPRRGRESAKSLPRLRKRPVQARAKFTVQAIYDAYVRIWRRDGLAALTTRAVAEESGFAIGTLYDYFPNKAALHAGYVRHVMDGLRERIRERVIENGQGPWRERLRLLVEITCAADEDAPFFDTDMHYIEPEIAAPRHHQRSFDALADAWVEAVAGWSDLDPQPAPATVRTLVFAVWGAMRYRLLADPLSGAQGDWRDEVLRICERTLMPGG